MSGFDCQSYWTRVPDDVFCECYTLNTTMFQVTNVGLFLSFLLPPTHHRPTAALGTCGNLALTELKCEMCCWLIKSF